MSFCWVINPRSGGQRGREVYRELSEISSPDSKIIELPTLEYLPDPQELRQYDHVIIAGGDGTFSKIASLLVDSDVRCAMFPLGTGNDLSREAGILGSHMPRSPVQYQEWVRKSQQVPLSFWRLRRLDSQLEDVLFCAYLSIGYDAKVIDYFEQCRRKYPFLPQYFGKYGNRFLYAVAAVQCGVDHSFDRLSVRNGSQDALSTEDACSVFFSNIQAVMGLGYSSCTSCAADRKIEAQPIYGRAEYMKMAVPGLIPKVERRSEKWLLENVPDGTYLQADGEVQRLRGEGSYELSCAGLINFCVLKAQNFDINRLDANESAGA